MSKYSLNCINYLKKPSNNDKKEGFSIYFTKKIRIVSIMRIFDIIKSELATDKLKAEEELERIINDKSLEIDDKVMAIKKKLNDAVIAELSFDRFSKLITPPDDTNEEVK
jgi:hypothetical protein